MSSSDQRDELEHDGESRPEDRDHLETRDDRDENESERDTYLPPSPGVHGDEGGGDPAAGAEQDATGPTPESA